MRADPWGSIPEHERTALVEEAKLAVIGALFDHVFECDEDPWPKRVVEALAWAKSKGATYQEAWLIAMRAYPPPADWHHRSVVPESLKRNGYLPDAKFLGENPSPFMFFYAQCGDEWHGTSFKRAEGVAA